MWAPGGSHSPEEEVERREDCNAEGRDTTPGLHLAEKECGQITVEDYIYRHICHPVRHAPEMHPDHAEHNDRRPGKCDDDPGVSRTPERIGVLVLDPPQKTSPLRFSLAHSQPPSLVERPGMGDPPSIISPGDFALPPAARSCAHRCRGKCYLRLTFGQEALPRGRGLKHNRRRCVKP